ncbi:uncharacterized protein MELLADRAFT_108187 [Melampsora larici-populina 98AG31]|uniref:Uncharacterized protein n=1 Tax=Melampsora larici-populina (strain 98AG31 / pathotype 3-4-7) TaxID=747676 RepID=F4RS97_MELLP|nr:uncharacterized protein MELLADRAFT_108187 [Melampsora larici-populina 98AG31]EGG04731.1 hypothetical protein MELLADRAFT_108187 [Melampsora larici-populina 98AG31]
MAPTPYARRLNRLRRKNKPATPVQEAFIAQQAKNRAQAGKASQALFQANVAKKQDPVDDQADWFNIPMDEEDEVHDNHPPEHRHPELEEDEYELLAQIARAQYDAKRLEKTKRWMKQCENMLPSFLRGRQLTSEWGDVLNRFNVVLKRAEEAQKDLANIESKNPTFNLEYIKHQWARQKEMQARIISETAADKREQILVLIELEEDVLEARGRLEDISAKRPRMRTGAERAELLDLPRSLIALEQKVQDLADELGSDEFLRLTGTSGNELDEARLIYLGLVRSSGRLWMIWNNGLRSMLESTSTYFSNSGNMDAALLIGWEEMRLKSAMEWAAITNLPSLIAEAEEDEEDLEHELDDEDIF